jgi:hypothetical protein
MPQVRDERTGRFTFGGRNPSARYTTNALYCTWKELVRRCINPKCGTWDYYGGRGITLHEPWLQFDLFASDIVAPLGPRPKGFVLGRLDLSKGFGPGNVRWVTQGEQTRKRRGVKLSIEIVSTIREIAKALPQKEIAGKFGLNQSTVSRILAGKRWAKC